MKEPRIKVWLARDKDGGLNMFLCKPVRGDVTWFGHGEFPLNEDAFPYVDWESEPIQKVMKLVEDDGNEEI